MPCGSAVAELFSVQPVVVVLLVEGRQGKDAHWNEILDHAFFGQSCTSNRETFWV